MEYIKIEVPELNSEVRFDLRGCLEAKMAVTCNMHMDTRVIEVADFKSEVKSDPRGH